MGSRGRPRSRLAGISFNSDSIAAISSGSPSPVCAETGMIRALSSTELYPLIVNQVTLGERDQSPGYMEKVQDGKVFARLRHHRFVRGHHQHRQVNSPYTGEHIVHEPLVPGYVNYADLVAAWEFKPREAQVYRQAAFLLLRQPVRVYSGERLDESGLAVINVACRAYNEHGTYLREMAVCNRITQGSAVGYRSTDQMSQ